MIDNMSMQQRVILATILSFLFFLVYSYIMPPQNRIIEKSEQNRTTTEKIAPTSTTDRTSKVSNQNITTNSVSSNSTTIGDNIIATINGDDFKVIFDDLGRIKQFKLKDKKHYDEKKGNLGNLFDEKYPLRALEIRFSDKKLNEEAFKTPYTTTQKEIKLKESVTITFTQKLSNLVVTKKVTFRKDGSYSLNISLSKDKKYFVSPGFRPNMKVDNFTNHGVIIKKHDGKLDIIEDGDATGKERYVDAIFVASFDRYYTTTFYKIDKESEVSGTTPKAGRGLNVFILKDRDDNPLVFVDGSQNFTTDGYIGAKEYDTLKNIDKELTDIIEYGFFTWLANPIFLLLKFLHSILGNWGWAIVVMTILIRLVLYPLTYKGMVSMNKLKELSPQIKELQAKYKGDPQKLQSHMMQLYKKHGANPMGGCLPMLLQIPVFFAIYRVLSNAVELKSAEWILWIHDLSVLDPYYILPILMGATMFWHQKITPTNITDPTQEKIMKFLPLIFTFFFVTFPAGLTLYWFVNNLFSIAQQYYVNRIFEEHKRAKKEKELVKKASRKVKND